MLALQRVDDLLVLAGAEGGNAERLGLAAGEQRRTVGTRQDADLGNDGAHGFGVAAIDAHAGVQDGVADHVSFQIVEEGFCLIRVQALGGQGLGHFSADGVDLVVARTLVRLAIRLDEAGTARIASDIGTSALALRRTGFRQGPGLLRGMLGQVLMIAWITGWKLSCGRR